MSNNLPEDKRVAVLARRAAATAKHYQKNREKILAERRIVSLVTRKTEKAIQDRKAYQPRKNELTRMARAIDPDKFRDRYQRVSPEAKAARAQRKRAYDQANKESFKDRAKARKEGDPVRWSLLERARKQKRRAQRIHAYPLWDREKTNRHMLSLTALCRILELVTGEAWHVDHMYPLRNSEVCGLHVWNNLQVLPARLNTQKRNQLMYTQPNEWKSDY